MTADEIFPADESLGPCMRALTFKQRGFVRALVDKGDGNATAAAKAAGYSAKSYGSLRVAASGLMHSKPIIAAIKEFSVGRLNGAAYIAVHALMEIAADPKHRDRQKAAEAILDRTGLPRVTAQQITVDEVDTRSTAELIALLREFAPRYGLDEKHPVSGAATIDGEFKELPTPRPADV